MFYSIHIFIKVVLAKIYIISKVAAGKGNIANRYTKSRKKNQC